MNKNELTIGQTYMTASGVSVTPLHIISDIRAIFVSEEYYPTPFVCWFYKLLDNNEIELSSGRYYHTLTGALESEETNSNRNRLNVHVYCPDCEKTTQIQVPLTLSVQSITEYIEDGSFCDTCHGRTAGAYFLELEDDDTVYTLPVYRGPIK